VREALLSPSEVLPVDECIGRIAAAATVGCPPAVPIVVSGEKIDESAAECFKYYGIETCAVIKK
jgi:arginine/lysine/ornithine decarboxylase